MTATPTDAATDAALEAAPADSGKSRLAIAAAAFLCVLWIGVVAVAALVFGALGCLGDSTYAICEAGSAAQTIEDVVGLWLPLFAAIAAGAYAVWRRSYRPIALTAALLWVLPPVAVVLVVEIAGKSM